MDRLTISVDEAARMLGIGRTLAYEAVRAGELPAVRIGSRWLIVLAALEELLADQVAPKPTSQTNGRNALDLPMVGVGNPRGASPVSGHMARNA